MRNKQQGFPPRMSLDGEPRAKAEYSPKRANRSINTKPQERMHRSSTTRDNDDY